jgi:1,4-alpha-glucan branching enzyme
MICEAAVDSYIPILWELQSMLADGISPRVTIGLTPTVMEQLGDQRFRHWFLDYVDFKAKAAHWDYQEWQQRGEGHLQHLAWTWEEHYRHLHRYYDEEIGRDLLGAFRRLFEDGHIEIIASAATHGYLPLLREDASVLAQIRQGIECFERWMGCRPRGFWLPECAYRPRCDWGEAPEIRGGSPPRFRPGIEEILADNGVEFFLSDTHMLSRGEWPLPVEVGRGAAHAKDFGAVSREGRLFETIVRRREADESRWPKSPHSAYFVGDAFEEHPPISVLFRDDNVCRQVWSADTGYPGDADYLEFHKRRFPGRHRYWRVTARRSGLGDKWPYEPAWAEAKAQVHAGHFLDTIKGTLYPQSSEYRHPVLCAAFDTELFGHWWHEGARWLGHLLRYAHADSSVDVLTVSGYLHHFAPSSAIVLPEGSWGRNGTHEVWLNPDTTWIWRLIYDAEMDMAALAREWGSTDDPVLAKLVAQAGRELLLLQASDLPFLITTKSAAENAQWRIHCHHSDFKAVAELARRYGRHERLSDDDWVYFGELAQRNRLFPDHHPSMWYT